MNTPALERADVAILGGGPSGSACARRLTQAGLRVVLYDAAAFPRVKLCAGWINPAVFEALEISPRDYPRGLWPWEKIFVSYRGQSYTEPCRGYFIRRIEFDDYLLQRSGAELRLGQRVTKFERDGQDWIIEGKLRARYLVGAAGTHCPIARSFPERGGALIAAQEKEFQSTAEGVARTRPGGDGECELLLHRDLGGYSWLAPKGDWLNVGSGTFRTKELLGAWAQARAHYQQAGRIPAESSAELDKVKGHSYYLFPASGLATVERDNAFVIGDALGLAHPATGEGIHPAIVSGQLCAEAILARDPKSYPARLRSHPLLRDYLALSRLISAGTALMGGGAEEGAADRPARESARGKKSALDRAVVKGFVAAFSGKPLFARAAFSAAGAALKTLAALSGKGA